MEDQEVKREDARSLVEKFISQVVEQGKLEAGARYFSPEAQDVHRLVETSICSPSQSGQ
jgi:hypothetical protein